MSLDKVSVLYKENKIDREGYLVYLVFACSEMGTEYMKHMQNAILMEEPQPYTGEMFAFYDGRRSFWRDVKRTIEHVDQLLSEVRDE